MSSAKQGYHESCADMWVWIEVKVWLNEGLQLIEDARLPSLISPAVETRGKLEQGDGGEGIISDVVCSPKAG